MCIEDMIYKCNKDNSNQNFNVTYLGNITVFAGKYSALSIARYSFTLGHGRVDNVAQYSGYNDGKGDAINRETGGTRHCVDGSCVADGTSSSADPLSQLASIPAAVSKKVFSVSSSRLRA